MIGSPVKAIHPSGKLGLIFLAFGLAPSLHAQCQFTVSSSNNGSPYAASGTVTNLFTVTYTSNLPPPSCTFSFGSCSLLGFQSGGPGVTNFYVLANNSPSPRSCTYQVFGDDHILGTHTVQGSFPLSQYGTSPPFQDPKALTVNDRKQGGCEAPKSSKPPSPGMAGYSFHSLLVSLNITDTPIGYTPPKGPPVSFTATYNQKESSQPATFNYSNLGPNWTFSWLSYVTDDPNNAGANVTAYARGGGTESYLAYAGGYTPERFTHAVLVPTGSSSYEKDFPDGSKEIFTQSDGSATAPRKIFLTSIVDPAGNAAFINYDAQLRITGLADALGQTTTVVYGLGGDPFKITQVTDPFGRSAIFSYNGNGQLASIQDPIGIISQFVYSGGNFISTLTTPYGTSSFVYGVNGTNQWLTATDPLNQTERIEYRDNAPGIAASELTAPGGMAAVNASLDVGNTFYWDKKAYAEFPGDYTKARITHWLLASNDTFAGLASSTREPLESRVFYTYRPGPANPGSPIATADMQSSPNAVGRVLDDGSTQLGTFAYNLVGKPTQSIDPLGRETDSIYAANSIDLLKITQKNGASNDVLFTATYNAQHLPLTTTDAAGQQTNFTYNSVGLPLTITNAKNETTTMVYDGNGYLLTVTGAIPGSTTAFTYDSAGRVQTVTDSEGYPIANAYDNLDRLTKQTFPDGTFRQTVYDRLSIGAVTDRLGRTTTYTNNAIGQVVSIKDPLNQVTNLTWCKCGALASLQDPKGNTTTWTRDVQGRATAKTYADGKGDTFVYENTTSRLKSKTDALGQVISYGYGKDGNLLSTTYTNAKNPTPNVSFAYDAIYNRRTSMTDGTGVTTYAYNPVNGALGAGRLASVTGPIANSTISYTYDQLGRVVGRSINGAANQTTMVYDALGRATSETNGLGAFTTAYVNQTARPSSLTYPNGQSTVYQYFNNTGDQRLKEIKNLSGAAILSQFDYAYDAEGQILSWGQQTSAANTYTLGYDVAGQLTSAALAGAAPKTFAYGYDAASNRTNETINGSAAPVTVNNLNELVSRTGSNPRSFAYDADGELISNNGTSRSSTNYTYQWDAENRLVAINYPTTNQQTLFTYDGLGRRAKIVEKTGGVVVTTKQFVWDGLSMAEERDGSGNLTKRFYSQGQVNGSTALFYTRDHLGSVREVIGGGGALQARYDYDPYGRRALTSGSDISDFGFTGHYYHPPSKLHLAPYRAYDSDSARWSSRDPIERRDTENRYAYVRNAPSRSIDPLGLFGLDFTALALTVGINPDAISRGWDRLNCEEISSDELRRSLIQGFAAGSKLSAVAAIAGLYVPEGVVYHFTSAIRYAEIVESGEIATSASGVGGAGVYVTRFSLPILARWQGAASTEVRVAIDASRVVFSATIVPGTYVARQSISYVAWILGF